MHTVHTHQFPVNGLVEGVRSDVSEASLSVTA